MYLDITFRTDVMVILEIKFNQPTESQYKCTLLTSWMDYHYRRNSSESKQIRRVPKRYLWAVCGILQSFTILACDNR